jgi:hypothetical protein
LSVSKHQCALDYNKEEKEKKKAQCDVGRCSTTIQKILVLEY